MGRYFVLGMALSCVANADTFGVQIGAFRHPEAVRIELPADVGMLRKSLGSDGLTRFVVGSFSSRADAQRALAELRAAGFGDAFVRAMTEDSDATLTSAAMDEADPAAPAAAGVKHEGSSISRRDLDKIMSLSEEERRDLVYLDGRLHKKIGDEFVPIGN